MNGNISHLYLLPLCTRSGRSCPSTPSNPHCSVHWYVTTTSWLIMCVGVLAIVALPAKWSMTSACNCLKNAKRITSTRRWRCCARSPTIKPSTVIAVNDAARPGSLRCPNRWMLSARRRHHHASMRRHGSWNCSPRPSANCRSAARWSLSCTRFTNCPRLKWLHVWAFHLKPSKNTCAWALLPAAHTWIVRPALY